MSKKSDGVEYVTKDSAETAVVFATALGAAHGGIFAIILFELGGLI